MASRLISSLIFSGKQPKYIKGHERLHFMLPSSGYASQGGNPKAQGGVCRRRAPTQKRDSRLQIQCRRLSDKGTYETRTE